MKMVKLILVMLGALSFLLVAGCNLGTQYEAEDCSECRDNPVWKDKEFCVMGEPGQLYCANPCLSSLGCFGSDWCVPLWDEGTYHDPCTSCIRWVCMPDRFYYDLNRVWYWGEDSCEEGGGDECPAGMQCLVDDSGVYDAYFCSDPCTTDASCVGGCCYDTGGESFCAPRDPYCI
jgi:hypothetical protein